MLRSLLLMLLIPAATLLVSTGADAYTITPSTWNIIGLDSNVPTAGPKYFPIGARVCGGISGNTDSVSLVWDAGGTDAGTYIYQRPGSANPVTVNFGVDGCADAFFEIEVSQVAGAYDQTRRYHITEANGGTSTPTRELYAEHLISQARNAITDVKLDGVSIPAGGAMNLVVGNTYTIQLLGGTATQGYNQFSSFFTLSNTIFQILSVNSNYSANDSPYVSPFGPTTYPAAGNPSVYADACLWDNDPASLTYRSCIGGDYKAGGSDVVATYNIRIIGGGGTATTLGSLLYDFSGSSYHYNGDYSVGARVANIIAPASVSIGKAFSPNPTNIAAGSTLTFTITNPNAGAVSGIGFTDVFPTTPGTGMQLKDTTINNTCGGTLTNNAGTPLAVNDLGIRLVGGTVPASGSCIVQVNVKTSATGSYVNTSQNLFVGAIDTGKTATATLVVGTTAPPAPPPSSCANPVVLARWEMNTTATGPGNGPQVTSKAGDVGTATADYYGSTGRMVSTVGTIDTHTNAWGLAIDNVAANPGWAENPTAPDYTMNNYFEFVLDTSNYGGIGVSFDAGLFTSGLWGNPTSPIYLTSTASGSTSIYATTPASIGKNAGWVTGLTASNMTAATTTTTFRFGTNGANKGTAQFALDNIVFTGCPRVKPPIIAKRFATNPILANGISTLVFTLNNPNPAVDLTTVTFTDVFPLAPGAMTLYDTATTNTCGGSLTNSSGGALLPGAPGIKLTGATVPKNGSCTVTVNVTAATQGAYVNSATVSDTTAGAGNTATDTLTVSPPHPVISLFKEVATAAAAPAPSSILWSSDLAVKAGSNLYYQFTVQNDGDVPLDTVTITDADLAAVEPGLSLANCVWKNGDDVTINPGSPASQNFTLAVANNSNNLDFAYCIIGPITAVAGTKTNTATANANYGGSPITPDSSTAKYNGFAVPAATKSFTPASIFSGGTSTMTITVTNPAANPGNLTGVSINDSYTGTLANNAAGSVACSGAGSATLTGGTNGGTAVGFTGGTIVPGGTCTITQSVTATSTNTNTTGTPAATGVTVAGKSASMALAGSTASATLTVGSPPSLMVVKSVQTYSDPVNGTTGPKPIPGAVMLYTIQVINSGSGAVDLDTTKVSDQIPANTKLFVGDINGAGSGPVSFTTGAACSPGTLASGLSCPFGGLANTSDCVSFSKNSGASYDTAGDIPVADADGFDAAVTDLKASLSGMFNGASGGQNSSFCLQFRVKVQ